MHQSNYTSNKNSGQTSDKLSREPSRRISKRISDKISGGLSIKLSIKPLRAGRSALLCGFGYGFVLVACLGFGGQPMAADNRGQAPRASSTAPASLAPESPIQVAYTLYQLKQYAASADAYEAIIRTAAPEPRLYYYAALANRESGRAARAKQLFEYISTNFAKTPEGGLAQTALGPATAKGTALAVATAPATGPALSAAPAQTKIHTKGARAFSPEEIAKVGANAIDQTMYPNCWFEASMSALAQLPRGQRLLANMIHYGDPGKFVVRFPGDGVEYVVSAKDAADAGITNRALWASLLECAQIRKFPDNQGAGGAYGDKSRLEVGMGCITGCKAEELVLANASVGDISSFIGGAVRSQSPIVAGTYDDRTLSSLPELVVGSHAYTIIGLDPAKNMVTVRNPHGAGARLFFLPSDPHHLKFEQLGDGVFKMNLELFPSYFQSLARSFI